MSIHQPAADPPSGRRTTRLTSSVVTSALLITALAPLAAAPAQAELVSFAPVTAADADGFPDWYSDGTVRLKLCVDPAEGCLAEPPDPNAPISYPGNFPGEAFWFAAEASGGNLGLYEAALEAAHTGEDAVAGTQIAFARLRFRLSGLVNGADYTITHPYGVHTFQAGEDPARPNEIRVTIDEGVCGTPCNFDSARSAFLGNYGGTDTTAPFIRQTNAPAGTLGSIVTPGPVTGAPSGFNYVEVAGPNAGGPGVNVLRVSTFNVQGVIDTSVDGAPSMPDLAAASDSGRSDSDNITNATLPAFTGTAAAGSTVELIVNGTATGVTTTAAADGSYSLTPTTALLAGANRIAARIPATETTAALDSGALAITVDTAPPATRLTSTPSNPSADTTPAFSFTSEASATFQCQLLPSNTPLRACTSPHTYDAQLNGSYTFNVQATDVAGNTGANATYSWQIGNGTTTPPPPPPGPTSTEQKDMTGDGSPDLVARDSAGRLWVYPGNGSGGFTARILAGTGGWNAMTAILQPGDFNGDDRPDVVARDSSGLLWLYRGNGAGGFSSGRVQIGTGWNSMTALATPGDFNGDGNIDLLARHSSGRLYMYPSNGAGSWLPRVAYGTGWNAMTAIVGTADFSGDGNADLFARDSSGRLYLYRGNGAGQFLSRLVYGTGWNAMTGVVGAGAFDTGATTDLVAKDSTGRLWIYRGNGAGGFTGARAQIGSGWSTYTIVQ